MFPWSFRIKNRLECRRTLLLSSMIWDLPVAKGCGQTPRHSMCVHASQILTNAQNHNSILWILDACSVLLSRFWTIVVSEHPISVLEYDTCVCPYKSQLIVSRFWTIVVSHKSHPISVLEYDNCVCIYESQLIVFLELPLHCKFVRLITHLLIYSVRISYSCVTHFSKIRELIFYFSFRHFVY